MNTNFLVGFKCPACGYESEFHIRATSLFLLSDAGVEESGGVEWNDRSFCSCVSCDFEGTVSTFQKEGR